MLTTAIGVSDHIDQRQAIAAVLDQCETALAGARPQAGILFTSIIDGDFPYFLDKITSRFPGIELIGCTTDGEIVADQGFVEDAVALLLLASDHLRFASAVACNLSTSGAETLPAAVADCRRRLDGKPALGIILPDGLTTIGLPLGRLIQQATGNTFPVFGGTAGDHYRLEKTYQFHNGLIYTDATPLLLISGDLTLSSQVVTGNEPIGRFYEVNRVEANVLHEIDGRRATDFYDELLGGFSDKLEIAQFPLAVYEPQGHDFCLRDPFLLDREAGTVTCVGTFPDHCRVRLTTISREDILRTAHEANERILAGHPAGRPELVLLFPCTSRRHVLGTRTNEEFAALHQADPPQAFFGFYCYGEIGPLAPDGPSGYHSDTYIAVALSERS
ncbi:FIST signal transduction protein [Desulfofustis glycolicus]|uniref:Uncharacterized conserved protein, contains FIST_N domain n=1 Tax=Desulfofustis glycolicus DSM 9705 TaxID=1121409 RepID=A0A1M5VQN2_9BACT|nr:FIST N-terminal domain-containing protein [Desulfofustis glycolicus]MCB2216789.1 FIST C-terminal domain-containing protein [Desulfobulbaceae bacterium]SHH77537.1 Uncharacterized conserved protein, contains FIST_N domain [Desulfofustis glycolicus DSM 9705]